MSEYRPSTNVSSRLSPQTNSPRSSNISTLPSYNPLSSTPPPTHLPSIDRYSFSVIPSQTIGLSNLQKLKTALRAKPLFLGNPHLDQHVQWINVDRWRFLVEKAKK
jgi:hypothetical protein